MNKNNFFLKKRYFSALICDKKCVTLQSFLIPTIGRYTMKPRWRILFRGWQQEIPASVTLSNVKPFRAKFCAHCDGVKSIIFSLSKNSRGVHPLYL